MSRRSAEARGRRRPRGDVRETRESAYRRQDPDAVPLVEEAPPERLRERFEFFAKVETAGTNGAKNPASTVVFSEGEWPACGRVDRGTRAPCGRAVRSQFWGDTTLAAIA